MKKVIVIGGGISGLSIAARLLSQGFDVTIYEKNNTIGGKTSRLTVGDFNFDLTASLLMIPDDYINVFSDCNVNYKNYFSLLGLNTLYKAFYHDNTSYKFYSNLSKLTHTVKSITNNNINDRYGYFKFLSVNYKKYLLAESSILNNSFLKSHNFLHPSTINKTFKIHTFSSSYKECSKYITSNKLKNYLMFQTMYIGASPYNSPNIYNLIPAISQFHGLFYIKGGMYSYVEALESLVLHLGGKINLSSPVDEILFKGKKAIGININGSYINSDILVCSSDYTYSLNTLIKDKHINHLLKPIENLEYSCSTFIMYLALDKKYPNLSVHNLYLNKNFKTNLEAPFNGDLPISPSLYIYCPSSVDNTLCPNGFETINVTVRVPNLLYNNIVWDDPTIEKLELTILNTLSTIDGLNDIKEHILFKRNLTPLDFKNVYNTYGGCAFGISHKLKQSAIFRPQCKLPKIKNLYFTGASVHPGNGVSMVLKSSKICAEQIIKEHSN